MLIKGAGASPGIARGTALVLEHPHDQPASAGADELDVDAELERLSVATHRAEAELTALRDAVRLRGGDVAAELLDAQILAHHDPVFLRQLHQTVVSRRLDAGSAVASVVAEYVHALDEAGDPYLRERAADVRDVGRRLRAMLDDVNAGDAEIPEGAIVVVRELLPSLTAKLEIARAGAIVAEHGGRMSHAAILARALQVPAVVGAPGAVDVIRSGDDVIVDGRAGLVFVRPETTVVREYDRLREMLATRHDPTDDDATAPVATADGFAIALLANIGKSADVDAALHFGAHGVGLFRTEFAFSIRAAAPNEEEQVEIVERVAERFDPRPVTVRLLDIGADKPLPYLPQAPSTNPALGRRGLRLLLGHREMLHTQLRAILRASARLALRLLVPMVGSLDDVRAIRAAVDAAARSLADDGISFARPPLGAMIEVPAAAIAIDAIVGEVDFVSLGTNDLAQYVLAVDREDDALSEYLEPAHPALLALIHGVADAAARAGKDASICGAMAADDRYTSLLIGLGLRSLSVPPADLPRIRRAIRRTRLGAATTLAARARKQTTTAAVEALLDDADAALR